MPPEAVIGHQFDLWLGCPKGFVRAAEGNADVLTDFRRVLGVTVRGENERTVGLEPRVRDAIPGAGRFGGQTNAGLHESDAFRAKEGVLS